MAQEYNVLPLGSAVERLTLSFGAGASLGAQPSEGDINVNPPSDLQKHGEYSGDYKVFAYNGGTVAVTISVVSMLGGDEHVDASFTVPAGEGITQLVQGWLHPNAGRLIAKLAANNTGGAFTVKVGITPTATRR